jgi:HSP20 family protein
MARDRMDWTRRVFLPLTEPSRSGGWQPPVDIYRTRDGWLVKSDLAGVRPEDVNVFVQGNRLSIRGSRHDCDLDEGCCHYRLEISYSHFERTIELPDNLERADISTEFRQGMLLVRIRKEAPR